ncbi:MAG: UDP-glucose 6-dehydrogenase [Acidobacteria bacterium RIFCSPLOWO2_12_FULL_65_11]|nr:MAG: UDP-glucose 6-dehydrogenase [Acidobacteria bacterium RIFCSPLOWO2_02_FULL_64_15]OFW31001.1 MAG: UDP-glucose 6-dehydrogenase [Acidobacteria bacterium RIFCSPLOWO2_12_FULL_65_11]
MKIAVVGTGYVGLVVGACLAENGNTVICVDKEASKIATLNDGKMPIYEPGLEEIVRRNRHEERLSFTTDLTGAVNAAEIVFIAVGTPQDEDGSADLQHVLAVAREVGRAMNKYTVVVDKSTVPVGTAARVRDAIGRETTQAFSVVSNPEFLKQGAAVEDFMKPDRVVIGIDDARAQEVMRELYRPFTRTGAPIMFMDTASAELSKYAANALLATRISFMNEIANVCELVGADVDQVRRAIGADRRIGTSFLFPGVGYGGSCFPKDVKALVRAAADKGYAFDILRAVEAVNQSQKTRLVEKMESYFKGLKGRSIALWGLAFKPRTDDMREAPAIAIIERLLAKGATVRAYDPEAASTARSLFGNRITICEKGYDALSGVDALAVVTEWNEFREPDFDRMRTLMKSPVVFDGRNIYSPGQMQSLGFTYFSIGR